ncbi:MAG: GTPase HflX, partial [Arenicellales bacterium]|nr:GTPase HflX [Arenicellales bacterium]
MLLGSGRRPLPELLPSGLDEQISLIVDHGNGVPGAMRERVLLVHQGNSGAVLDEDFAELEGLALSAGALVVGRVPAARRTPHPSTFVGSGKSREIAHRVQEQQVDLVIIDQAISPVQERNLESAVGCRVIDRTRLILDIFALRARTSEGKMQVELAQLKHLSTRLIRGWTHLERQRGGIGLRGPGETQLESDRRMLGQRIRALQKRLQRVGAQRGLRRRRRNRVPIPTVTLVGYTNAGKSSLFNRLVSAEAFAADQLFATLGPTMRKLKLPAFGAVVLSDTVGFITGLPHTLVQAFQSTLEEIASSSLLLQVADDSD